MITAKVFYYDGDDYGCTEESRAIEHANTEHIHCDSDEQVVKEYIRLQEFMRERWAAKKRYVCLTGPGGRVAHVQLTKEPEKPKEQNLLASPCYVQKY